MEFVLCVVIMMKSADYASREKFVVYPIKTVYTNRFINTSRSASDLPKNLGYILRYKQFLAVSDKIHHI